LKFWQKGKSRLLLGQFERPSHWHARNQARVSHDTQGAMCRSCLKVENLFLNGANFCSQQWSFHNLSKPLTARLPHGSFLDDPPEAKMVDSSTPSLSSGHNGSFLDDPPEAEMVDSSTPSLSSGHDGSFLDDPPEAEMRPSSRK
jgi:hypothetical protein